MDCPWNYPGQNTEVGSLSLLQGIFPTQGLNPGLPHCNSLSGEPQGKPKNTGVGSLSLLQWIFPIQELNWDLLHCRRILYQLSYARSQKKWKLLSHVQLFAIPGILQARIPEWVVFPFLRGSSKPRDQTQVSHIAGGFFTSLATREAQEYWIG